MEQTNLFYNTISLAGDELKEAQHQVEKQDKAVLHLFRRLGSPLIPFDVQAILKSSGYDWPITSIRRAITRLTGSGELIKLDKFKDGIYGKRNHKWIISSKQNAA